ncbi:MAG: hypothetical protein IJE40_02215 [Clostridia bacterium]|nr:hypothetical protein [Clostridia bacterium]
MNDKWIKLDNAAKIFPSAVSGADTKVFRFSCELFEDINKEILQSAASEAAEVFDVFNYVLKKGLFWYYFEKSELRPIVEEENKPVCGALYNKENKDLLYRISYYGNRINLEVFHALTDGTGALMFLECIVNKYLSKAHNIAEAELAYDASAYEKEDDSFYRYYEEEKKEKHPKTKHRKAYKFRNGPKFPDDRLGVISGNIDLKETLAQAHLNNTTLTGYLSAILLCSIHDTMPVRARKLPVVLTIPVNLRKHFASSSARNFFGTVNIDYNFKNNPSDIKNVAEKISRSLKAKLSEENLEELLLKYSSVENNFFARIAPLAMKNVCLKIAHDYKMKETSGTFSNIGKASVPKSLEPYIKSFNICCATKAIQACAVSFGNTLTVSFTSPYENNDIQKNFFRRLTENGIHVEISSNMETFDTKTVNKTKERKLSDNGSKEK